MKSYNITDNDKLVLNYINKLKFFASCNVSNKRFEQSEFRVKRFAGVIQPSLLKRKIFEALDNALENGYSLIYKEAIAFDLISFNSDFEKFWSKPKRLYPYIQEWLETSI